MKKKILIGWGLLCIWIIWLIIMIIFTIILPILFRVQWTHASPYWYRDLMNMMYIGWIILSIFALFGIGYLVYNRQKEKVSDMSDEEIVDYYMTHGV